MLLAASASAAPIITEIFFNPPGGSEAAYEWFEIYNPGPGDLVLAGMVVESRSATSQRLATVSNSAAPLAVGAYSVLAARAGLGINCYTATPTIVLEGEFALNNSPGSVLALFAAGTVDLVNTIPLDVVAYIDRDFSSQDGVSIQLTDVTSDNYLASNWTLAAGAAQGCAAFATTSNGDSYGNPGRPNAWCSALTLDGGVGEDRQTQSESVCVAPPPQDANLPDLFVPTDAFIDDAYRPDNVLPPFDGGPQHAPSITLSQPSVGVNAAPSAEIVYSASDPDGEPVAVALFYDADNSGYDGVLIAEDLPASGAFVWTPSGLANGTYFVFGRVRDARGAVAYAYAPGSVLVPRGDATQPFVEISAPQAAEQADESFTIIFAHNGLAGTVSLYYDTNATGEDGTAIIGGLAAPGGPTRVRWDTRNVDEGKYFVYARYETDAGVVVAYSPGTVTIMHAASGGCSQAVGAGGGLFGLFLLTWLLLRCRKPAAWR
jgi:hypothetical protein